MLDFLHLLLHFAKSPEDRKVRPAFLWAVAILLATAVVWSWMIPISDDPHVPAGLVWVIRIFLSIAFVGVARLLIRTNA